jgi:hypothetical protein
MFTYLKALAARLTGRGFGGLPAAPASAPRAAPPAPPAPPEDPYAGVREPRKRGPGGKSTAVAVAEPAEHKLVRAYGHAQGRGGISNSEGPYEG